MRPERRPSGRNGGAASAAPTTTILAAKRKIPGVWGQRPQLRKPSSDLVLLEGSRTATDSWRTSGSRGCSFCPPTPRAALEYMPVMQDAVEHGGDRGHIAQQFAPIFNRPVGSEQRSEEHTSE